MTNGMFWRVEFFFDFSKKLDAIQFRHFPIAEDQVNFAFFQFGIGIVAVSGDFYILESCLFQLSDTYCSLELRIFDD